MAKGYSHGRNNHRLRVTNGHRAAVCALVIAGLGFPEACRIVGASPKLLRHHLRRHWYAPVHKPKKWRGDLLAELRAAYTDRHMPLRSISQMYGIGIANISTLARNHGWPMRGLPPRLPPMSDEALKVYRKLRSTVGRKAAERQALLVDARC